MKYESTILKRLIDTYGVVGNPRYISEIINEFIVRGKESFPNLFTYQADWLAHIDEFGLNPTYTVSYTGQSIYAPNTLEKPIKSAILKGCTIKTSKITWLTGKYLDANSGNVLDGKETHKYTEEFFECEPNTIYEVIGDNNYKKLCFYDSNKTFIIGYNSNTAKFDSLKQQSPSNACYLRISTSLTSTPESPSEFSEALTVYNHSLGFSVIGTKLEDKLVSVKMPVLTTSNTEFLTTLPISFFEENNPVSVSGWANFNLPRTLNDVTIKCKVNGLNELRLNYNKSVTITNNDLKNGIEIKVDSLTDIAFHGDGIGYATKGNLIMWLKDGTIELGINEKGSELVDGYKIPYKSNILTVNEDVTLRSNGDICDELNLLTGQLTQRIDEDGEVLSQEVVKTVDLTILDQNGHNVKQLMSFNGGTHFNTTSLEGSPLPVVSVSVETDLEEILTVCSLEGNTL